MPLVVGRYMLGWVGLLLVRLGGLKLKAWRGGGGGGGGGVGRNLIMLTSILYNRNVFRKEELTKMVFLQMDLRSCSHNDSVSRNNPVKLPMVERDSNIIISPSHINLRW